GSTACAWRFRGRRAFLLANRHALPDACCLYLYGRRPTVVRACVRPQAPRCNDGGAVVARSSPVDADCMNHDDVPSPIEPSPEVITRTRCDSYLSWIAI